MAYLIDGKAISKQIKDELQEEVKLLKEQGILPCLAVIQVGKDPASSVYVNNKKKFKTNLIGDFNQKNIAFCYQVCALLGLSEKTFKKELKSNCLKNSINSL